MDIVLIAEIKLDLLIYPSIVKVAGANLKVDFGLQVKRQVHIVNISADALMG